MPRVHNAKLSEFQPDPHNANKGTQRGRGMLEHSLTKLGAGRSIVVDRNNVTIGGAKTLETAVESGFEDAIVVETDGSQLVVVRRTDLDMATDARAKELAIADNRVSETSLDWDVQVLAELQGEGVDLGQFWMEDELGKMLDGLTTEMTGIDAVPNADDRGIAYQNKFAVAVECECEAHQEDVYNKLLAMGYKCKVLTL